jgi:hypothetical protein
MGAGFANNQSHQPQLQARDHNRSKQSIHQHGKRC